MPRYRRPRRQGVIYGPVTQPGRGSDGDFVARILGILVVMGAVALLGLGALAFVGDDRDDERRPSPTTVALESPSPPPSPPPATPLPTEPPATPATTPATSPQPTPDTMTPAPTPFEITVEEGPGHITFGTGRGSNLSVSQPGTTFELGQRIFYSARLVETTPTDAVSIRVSKYDVEQDAETAVTELSVNTRIPRFHTLRQRLNTSNLDGPAIYVMRFMRGDNTLAEGWFEITE